MITLTLHRSDLVAARACADGLALYDAIAVASGRDSLVIEWTPLAQLWLAREYPPWSSWLYESGLAPRVSLARANLDGADLVGACLRGANLARASLARANLDGASLAGAYLYGASLAGAYLYGANLDGAWRDSDDPAVDGWRVVAGRMVR